MRLLRWFVITLVLVTALDRFLTGKAAHAQNPASGIGERPALEQQADCQKFN